MYFVRKNGGNPDDNLINNNNNKKKRVKAYIPLRRKILSESGLALGKSPDARLLRWGYQHVGIFCVR